MKSEPMIGSPPMPTIEELPVPGLFQLVADLVGQRARLGDDADRARVEELRRDDADVGLARREGAGAVGAEQPHPRLLRLPVEAEHVEDRDPLGDRDHRLDAGLDRLVDRRRGEARRDEDHRGVGAGLGDRFGDLVEDRDALDVLAALAGGDAGDEVGAVGLVAETVEGALAAGQPGDDQLRVVADDDAHLSPPAPRRCARRRASSSPGACSAGRPRRGSSGPPRSWCRRAGRPAAARGRSASRR